jgi:hypothetical protein
MNYISTVAGMFLFIGTMYFIYIVVDGIRYFLKSSIDINTDPK